jgi:hypothetical protein
MPHIRFSFLYRDAANYKTFSDLIFANPEEKFSSKRKVQSNSAR